MSTLGDLFAHYGSDKYLHGYDRLYERILKRDTGSLLEVGIGTRNPDGVDHTVHDWFPADYTPGGSLRAFADYLPGAYITGLDIEPDCVFAEGRITGLLCDSTSWGSVVETLGAAMYFDVIIDDGEHTEWAQLRTLRNLWPHLAPGGTYVIEDATTITVPHIVDIVGFDAWRTARMMPSQSCPLGFIAVAIEAP